MRIMPNSWTPEQVITCQKLALLCYSASDIADKLGNKTKNAVIGFAHRNGIKLRNKSRGPRNGSMHVYLPSPPKNVPVVVKTALPSNRKCQFIRDDPRTNAVKCDAPVHAHRSYCLEHCVVVYQNFRR